MYYSNNLTENQFLKKLNHFVSINESFCMASIYYHDQEKDFCQQLSHAKSQFTVFLKRVINEFDKVSKNNQESSSKSSIDFSELSLITKNVNSLILRHDNSKLLEIIAEDCKKLNDFLLLITKDFCTQKIYRDILINTKKEVRLVKYELNY